MTPDGGQRQTGYNSAFAHDPTQAPPVIQSLAAPAFLAGLMAMILPVPGQAEPRIVVGPTDSEEEPEVVDTVSGLSYDQLKRLRELRKWLDQRQMIREQIRLSQPEAGKSALFADRQLLAPMGQRADGKLPGRYRVDPKTLKLPPLPRFDDDDPNAEAAAASRRITHITPPAPGGAGHPQIEYELDPVDP